jgi:hypothetical protein
MTPWQIAGNRKLFQVKGGLGHSGLLSPDLSHNRKLENLKSIWTVTGRIAGQ